MNDPRLRQIASSIGVAGMTMPQRLMSRSRPDGILVRVVLITLILTLISYGIFGIV